MLPVVFRFGEKKKLNYFTGKVNSDIFVINEVKFFCLISSYDQQTL